MGEDEHKESTLYFLVARTNKNAVSKYSTSKPKYRVDRCCSCDRPTNQTTCRGNFAKREEEKNSTA